MLSMNYTLSVKNVGLNVICVHIVDYSALSVGLYCTLSIFSVGTPSAYFLWTTLKC